MRRLPACCSTVTRGSHSTRPAVAAEPGQTGVSVTPVHAGRRATNVSSPTASWRCCQSLRRSRHRPTPAAPVTDLTGQWNVRIQYAASTSNHMLHLSQKGNDLGGFHQGEFMTREMTGTIDGDAVRIRSAYGEQHGDSVNLTFTGKVSGDQMGGRAGHG